MVLCAPFDLNTKCASRIHLWYAHTFTLFFLLFFSPLFLSNCPCFFFGCTKCAMNASFSVNTPFIKVVTLLSRRICIHCINCAKFCRLLEKIKIGNFVEMLCVYSMYIHIHVHVYEECNVICGTHFRNRFNT